MKKAIFILMILMGVLEQHTNAQNITNNTIGSSQTIICSPSLLNGSYPSGGTGTYSFVWLKSPVSATTGFVAVSGTNNTQNYQPPLLFASTWYKRVVNSGTFTDTSNVVNITVVNSFTTSPSGPINVAPNTPVTLCVSPASTNLYYQWVINIGSFNNYIPGATNSCYTMDSAVLPANYFCIVYQGTCSSINSNPVTVSPNYTANIYPSGAVSLCAGNTLTLSTPATTGNTYQWYFNNNPIAGATNATYTASTTGKYQVHIVNGSNLILSSITSIDTLTVSPTLTNLSPCGDTITLTANTISGLSYQWYLNGSAISGATNTTYHATTVGSYQVIGNNGICNDTSNTSIVVSQPNMPIVTGPIVFCSGSTNSTTLCVSPAYQNAIYQWEESPCGFNTWAPISGGTNPCFNAQFFSPHELHCVVTYPQCGLSFVTNTTCLTASPATSSISPAGTYFLCTGSSVTLTATVNPGYSYQWYLNGNPIAGATNITYTTSIPGDYQMFVNTGTYQCFSATTTIDLNTSIPPITISPSTATICIGTTQALWVTFVNNLSY